MFHNKKRFEDGDITDKVRWMYAHRRSYRVALLLLGCWHRSTMHET